MRKKIRFKVHFYKNHLEIHANIHICTNAYIRFFKSLGNARMRDYLKRVNSHSSTKGQTDA